jgi:hypothetical protein
MKELTPPPGLRQSQQFSWFRLRLVAISKSVPLNKAKIRQMLPEMLRKNAGSLPV